MTSTSNAAPNVQRDRPTGSSRRSEDESRLQSFPWWILIIVGVLIYMGGKIATDPDYDLAWSNIAPGVWLTIRSAFIAFGVAVALGLLVGLGQISKFFVLRNLSRAYIELIRGIPTLPLIFVVALVVIPDLSEAAGQPNSVPTDLRAILALAILYSAYIAEIIRGGVAAVPPGQTEAGRSLGLSRGQTMRSIVLPQAGRAIIPPIANDFIAILKDTSLLSVLGALEITRRSRQFSASTFKFQEAYFTLAFLYLVLVLGLSVLLRLFENWMTKDQRGAR